MITIDPELLIKISRVAAVLLAACFLGGVVLAINEFWKNHRAEKQERKEQDEAAGAEANARELLLGSLSPKECRQLKKKGFVDIPSGCHSGRTYRVSGQPWTKIYVYEKGKYVCSLCVYAEGDLPDSDLVLAKILSVKGNEDEVLKEAQVSHLT